jgi:D-3-phosphoglycerate dehydrogenase
MKPSLLLLEPMDYSEEAIATYQSFAQVSALAAHEVQQQHQLQNANILVTRLGYTLNAEFLRRCPALISIVTPTTGLDHIDLTYCHQHHIEVLSLRGQFQLLQSITSTAEHTIALMLAAVRHILPAHSDVLNGNWKRDAFKGWELQGKTLGIFGLGRIGGQVARLAKAFQMKVCAHDPVQGNPDLSFVTYMHPEELVKTSDIISLHMNAEGNHHFVNAHLLSLSRKGAGWINTARAALWDEEAAASLVLRNHLAWVATDVLSGERDESAIRQNPLYLAAQQCDRIIITPHLGGATTEAMQTTEKHMALVCKEWHAQRSGIKQ